LSNITLNFSPFRRLGAEKDPFLDGLACLDPHRIQKFHMRFFHDVSDEDLIKFCDVLKKFGLLTVLHLSFWQYHAITNVGISKLCTTLSKLLSLQSLDLSLNFEYNHDPLVQNFASALRSLQNLVFLNLKSASTKKTTKDEIQQLFSNLGNLKSLKFVTLSLPWMNFDEALTDYELKILGQSLDELPHLRDLILYFGRAKLITKLGIEEILHVVQRLENLSTFKFEIPDTIQIDETNLDGKKKKFASL